MIRISSPTLVAFLPALALTFAAPAFADTAIPKGEALCKAAAAAQQPAPASTRINKDETTANGNTFNMIVRVKYSDGAAGKLACTVDRTAGTAAIAANAGVAVSAR